MWTKRLLFILFFVSCSFAKVIFRANFETGDLSEWSTTGTRGQNATPANIQVVTDIVQEGKYAGKFTIHENDVFNAQQQRVQVGGPRITAEEGSDTYMSFYLYMAEAPKDRDNFFYWEGQPPPRYDNVMTWWLEPKEGGGASIQYGTGNLGHNGTEWAADFAIGKWHQLAMHIHWSEDKDKGNTRLWFDGVLVLDKKLKTKGPESVYFCQPGIHRSPHRPSVDTIYFDNFILADTLEEIFPKTTNLRAKPWTLAAAIAHREPSVVEMLLKLRVDPNALDWNGETPLEMAAQKGDSEMVQLLVTHGADVRARSKAGTFAIHTAALEGNAAIVQILLDHGAPIDCRVPASGETPLYYAAAFGRVAVVELLLRQGADASLKNKQGLTALAAAEKAGQAETARILRAAAAKT